ncbi:MAG TPA: PIG-L deacetylase family protein [Solirubrobacteraceae bacterium]|jgi:LmbE family N-acetylglucosaminyl deacetylase|nr:PIG-L deacetylase family protein [Solirubrobacteraceae bacterium]
MLALEARRAGDAPLKLLAIGAHSDDIEIGCGGTILKLIEQQALAEVCWVVLTGGAERAAEAGDSAEAMLAGVPSTRVILKEFRDGYFPYEGGELKSFFEELKREVSPDVILTHQRADLHQDHRVTCELTWNTFRDHLVLEYEIPKYDGDMSVPNLFVSLHESLCRRKIEHLMTHFGSQRSKRWFADDLFSGLLRLRGMECNSPTFYAEAFHCRKALVV